MNYRSKGNGEEPSNNRGNDLCEGEDSHRDIRRRPAPRRRGEIHHNSPKEGDSRRNVPRAQEVSKTESSKRRNRWRRPIRKVESEKISGEAKGSDKAKELRDGEIKYIKRRFRNTIILENPEGSTDVVFEYRVVTNDWAFSARSIFIDCRLPEDYPIQKATVGISRERNVELPDILCNHLTGEIQKAVDSKFDQMCRSNEFETIAKWLIKWVDQNVFTMFVAGLRKTKLVKDAEAAGISLILPSDNTSNSSEENTSTSDEESCSGSEEEDDDGDDHIGEENSAEDEESDESECAHSESGAADNPIGTENPRPPIAIIVSWHDMSRNVASLSVTKMHISTRCSRCKQETDIEVPANDKKVGWRCPRCSIAHSLRVRPEIVHENSSIVARLDARGCRPIDCILLNTQMKYVCFVCDTEDDVQKLSYGESHKSWCKKCHKLIQFTISTIRFRGDFSKTEEEDSEAASRLPKQKKKKVEVQSGISDGHSLPDNGTCKHYRKSFRWFRFPCCGKVFACDKCHDEKEDHEMKLANRIICGFCCKEQPFSSNKPCVRCRENVTLIRSSFWEGGKGCRDQVYMSRKDPRKYANITRNKTQKKK